MKFPHEAINRFPELGDKTSKVSGNMEQLELEMEQAENTVNSFAISGNLEIGKEHEGKLPEDTYETGTDHADSWARYMEMAIDDGIRKNPAFFESLKNIFRIGSRLTLGADQDRTMQ